MQRAHKKNVLQEALSACKANFWYTLAFSFFSNILVLIMPIYSMQVLDKVVGSNNVDTLIWLTIIVLLSFVALGVLQAVKSAIFNKMADWLDNVVSSKLLSASVALSAIVKSAQGSQVMRDFATIKSFLTGAVLAQLLDLPWAVMFIIVIFLIHPDMGVLSLVGVAALLIMAYINEVSTRKILQRSSNSTIKTIVRAEAATRNAEVIEAMGMMPQIIEYWEEENAVNKKLQNQAADRSNVIGSISKMVRLMLQAAIYSFGSLLVLHHEMTVGQIIATSIISGRAYAPFESAISSWKSLIMSMEAYKRINLFLSRVPERREGMALPEPTGELAVEKVIFRAPGTEHMIIKGASFKLDAGDSLGIIGPSAAGKSTLAKLIVGLWQPLNGHIRLDGADVYTWNRNDFGRHVGYLPQDVELFAGTVKDNIARMNKRADPEDVIEAARMAGVHDMILRLPKGYETEIGEFGSTLSAGQRQRIGLARAIYGNPKLLVLDEPNSNLDTDGEAALSKCLVSAKQKNITAIIIAHRPSVLANVDKIALMRDGMVEMFGPRSEVMAKLSKAAPQQAQPQQQQIQGG